VTNLCTTDDETTEALTSVLIDALRALGAAGRPEQANRLAGHAWTALRRERPQQAQRVNALMHKLARLPDTDQGATMPTTDPQLDVRSSPPARRHELIFENYASLPPGEGFVLINDHDPKPLYYQLAAEHAGQFEWDHLEEGPQTWRVRIGRPA
jgi:uncharacterized protein (DUF2249 family)